MSIPGLPSIDGEVLAELHRTPGRVFAWLFPLAPPPTEGLIDRLAPDEQERGRRFHFERDRNRFILARSGMRAILGACLQTPPEKICFRYGIRGKPSIAEPPSNLHFNLSHSGDWAILAVAGEPVGVDLEQIHPRVEAEQLARRFFSSEDRSWLLEQPEDLRQRAFFRLWVTREAWLKATGDGLSFPLDRLITHFTGGAISSLEERDGTRRGTVLELEPIPPGYCAAVAVRHPSPRVTLMQLQESPR